MCLQTELPMIISTAESDIWLQPSVITYILLRTYRHCSDPSAAKKDAHSWAGLSDVFQKIQMLS